MLFGDTAPDTLHFTRATAACTVYKLISTDKTMSYTNDSIKVTGSINCDM